jgi:hypothetical protein
MSEKFVVVQGAICKCQFGKTTDKIKVLSHEKEYANDKDGTKKLIVTTKEIGAQTFDNNTFGSCSKMNESRCTPMVKEWQDFYKDVLLSNGGNIIVEDSKAVCSIAGTPCIEITNHGQITEASKQNFKNTNKEVHNQLNPMVDVRDVTRKERNIDGITFDTK